MSSFLMNFSLPPSAKIMHERDTSVHELSTWANNHLNGENLAEVLDVLAAAYAHLAIISRVAPNPDQLLRLGPVGQLIHAVSCHEKGSWAAFREGVARRYSGVPFPTPLMVAGHRFHSFSERYFFETVRQDPDVIVKEVHPKLGGSCRRADFLLASAIGRNVYVEVTMLTEDPASADNPVHAKYRRKFGAKLTAYADLGIELPVVIDADDLAPCRLAAKIDEIRHRLGLPPRAWNRLEAALAGGLI